VEVIEEGGLEDEEEEEEEIIHTRHCYEGSPSSCRMAPAQWEGLGRRKKGAGGGDRIKMERNFNFSLTLENSRCYISKLQEINRLHKDNELVLKSLTPSCLSSLIVQN